LKFSLLLAPAKVGLNFEAAKILISAMVKQIG